MAHNMVHKSPTKYEKKGERTKPKCHQTGPKGCQTGPIGYWPLASRTTASGSLGTIQPMCQSDSDPQGQCPIRLWDTNF